MAEKIKVLIVEDDPIWLEKILKIMTNDKFDNKVAIDLATTLSSVKDIDLIILDIILPDSTAINTLQAVTASAPFIPIIVITTITDENILKEALILGVQDFIMKNEFNIETFKHAAKLAVHRLIARVDLNNALQSILNNLKSLESRLDCLVE